MGTCACYADCYNLLLVAPACLTFCFVSLHHFKSSVYCVIVLYDMPYFLLRAAVFFFFACSILIGKFK